MPGILLSDCGNENAEYCNGAKESAVMDAILEQLLDYLEVSGIHAQLRPDHVPSAAVSSIANRERANLLFLLRSTCAHPKIIGRDAAQGCCVCYHPRQANSKQIAEILSDCLSGICPHKEGFAPVPAPQLPDFHMAHCPAVQVQLGCRDNAEESAWMTEGVGVISHALAKGITRWFDVPCKSPFANTKAIVNAPAGALLLRQFPSKTAPVLETMPNGTALTLLHHNGEWQYAELDGICGFCLRQYLRIGQMRTV
jgi:N-acetylmuramoyl-L-alanine amidase